MERITPAGLGKERGRGESVARHEWLARTVSPDYSQTVCCSGGIIRPDCATRKAGAPDPQAGTPRIFGVLQEYVQCLAL